MRKLLWISLVPALFLFVTINAQGGESFGTLSVRATAAVTCVVSSKTLNFGDYTGAAMRVSETTAVQCTAGTPYTISYGPGDNFNETRRMVSIELEPPSFLIYGLECASEELGDINQECGDGIIGGPPINGIGTGLVQQFPVDAYLNSNQFVEAATYEDSVLITVSY